MLELLAECPRTVGELADGTDLELSHLSQQVGVRRRAGVVDSRWPGNDVICSLQDPQTAELRAVARRMLTADLRPGQGTPGGAGRGRGRRRPGGPRPTGP